MLPTLRDSGKRITVALKQDFSKIQNQFATTAGFLCKGYLFRSWRTEQIKRLAETEEPTPRASQLSSTSLQLAEDFVAYVYANFVVTVLLRIRGLVFSMIAIYACIVFSTISYPFQPAPALSLLAVLLFLLGALAVGYVYEEMHRDPTLSRLTSTEPGKLDAAFWTKFAAAGIVPIVTLVASLFPQAGHFLYSIVQPVLQALR